MNDQNAQKIPGLIRTVVGITVPEGACCYGLPTPSCAYTTQSDCMGDNVSYPPPKVWTEGNLCPPAGPDCPSCTEDGQCADPYDPGPPEVNPNGGVCTIDTCVDYVCYNTPDYDPNYCCNPVTGDLIIINDQEANPADHECTNDVCNGDGSVDHDPLTGTSCTHLNACVINDECDAGVCVGDLPPDLMIPCPGGDTDCPAGWFCNIDAGDPMEGYCDCRLSTPLAIVKPDECVAEDEHVFPTLSIEAGSAAITGFQSASCSVR
jgi:hypothetical protein